VYAVVKNQDQFDQALAAGFAPEPPAHVETPVQVSVADAAPEADDPPADEPKKRGRKPKAE